MAADGERVGESTCSEKAIRKPINRDRKRGGAMGSRARQLLVAAKEGQLEIVRWLVEVCDAEIEFMNADKDTPLSWASWNGHTDVVSYLIEECQANVKHVNKWSTTPLVCAVLNKQAETMHYLVQYHLKFGIDFGSDMQYSPVKNAIRRVNIERIIKRDLDCIHVLQPAVRVALFSNNET